MKFTKIDALNQFVVNVENHLLRKENRRDFAYPNKSITPWDTNGLDEANQELLSALSGEANIYAIFTANKSSESFSLRYIGKTTNKLARQRVRNHLIKKHERTGAKLQDVVKHVQSGGTVQISWLKIEPESLRNCVEEELIKRHKEADWNRENS